MNKSDPVTSKEELQTIIQMLHKRHPIASMMIEFEARTGLRYSDTSKLKFDDVMINGVPRARFDVIQSKALQSRLAKGIALKNAREKSRITINANEQLKELIRQIYILNGHNKLLFQSNHHNAPDNTAISIQFINRQLKAIASELKLDYQLSTHSMRKSFTYMLMEGGASLNILRDALGHSDAKTTNHYISSIKSDLETHQTSINF